MNADLIHTLATRFFAAIERGDQPAVEEMWAPDVAVWHIGDRRDCDRDRALKVIGWFIATTTTRRYDVLDRRVFDGGFVQQHVLHADGVNGAVMALRVCIVVKVAATGSIARIDEYFDPADLAPLLT